jgi:tetratricopeptide (TPR) repeat protein
MNWAFAPLFGCALLVTCDETSGQPPQSPQTVEQAIKQLADLDFKVREQATQYLINAGEKARPAVEAVTKSDDAEVAQRARSILRRIALGVGPGMPDTVVALMERFAIEPKSRSMIVQGLQEPDEFLAIRNLLPAVKDAKERAEMQSQFRTRLRFVALTRYRAKDVPAAERLMVLDASDAEGDAALHHYWFESGLLKDRIRELAAKLMAAPDQGGHRRLAMMYRAAGDLANARDHAVKARSVGLQMWLAAEANDWEDVLRLHRSTSDGKTAKLPTHAMSAFLCRQTSDESGLDAGAKSILRHFDDQKSNPRGVAEALLAAERYDDAALVYERSVPAKSFYLLWQRQEYERAFTLANISAETPLDREWHESLPAASKIPGAYDVPRQNYARDVAIALHEVGRHGDAVRICELLHSELEAAPFNPYREIHVVQAWLGIAERKRAVEETIANIEMRKRKRPAPEVPAKGPAARATVTITPDSSPSELTELFPPTEFEIARGIWPGLYARYDGKLSEIFDCLERNLNPSARAALSPEQQAAELRDVLAAADKLTDYRKASFFDSAGVLCYLYGDGARGDQCWDQMSQWSPRDAPAAARARGEKLLNLGQWAAAEKWFANSEAGGYGPTVHHAIALLQLGRHEEASAMFTRMKIATSPDGYYLGEALHLVDAGSTDEALTRLRLARRLMEPASKTTAQAFRSWATKEERPLPPEAADLWRLGIFYSMFAATSEDPLTTWLTAPSVLHAQQALVLIQRKDPKRALAEALLAAAASPRHTPTLAKLVRAFENAGYMHEADEIDAHVRKRLLAICRSYPRSTVHRNQLARFLAAENRRLDEALTLCHESLEVDARHPDSYAALGEVETARGNLSKARAAAEAGLKNDPAHPACLQLLKLAGPAE